MTRWTHFFQGVNFNGQFDNDAGDSTTTPYTFQQLSVSIDQFPFCIHDLRRNYLVGTQAVVVREGTCHMQD